MSHFRNHSSYLRRICFYNRLPDPPQAERFDGALLRFRSFNQTSNLGYLDFLYSAHLVTCTDSFDSPVAVEVDSDVPLVEEAG